MRGEHGLDVALITLQKGSSPHARGALHFARQTDGLPGIIPACAGSTPAKKPFRVIIRDHPRMRGEHSDAEGARNKPLGSSPHARGAHPLVIYSLRVLGIIPACAGSTLSGHKWRIAVEDHPRMRGEHLRPSKVVAAVPGSSPHARGAPSVICSAIQSRGIIPACAGSTNDVNSSLFDCGDHPRMRGEHKRESRITMSRPGSSPHARGALRSRLYTTARLGIIPACAGSTILLMCRI